ncbi:MAG TPA: orotidine 5'-phosphate decarboxylase / HUMPS family protein [Chthonomonadaceae bacterium]|nr:orotidine 5'-phosphate decarboxylase / HUMPS family protein [Chthonomonadaceae bacterium]
MRKLAIQPPIVQVAIDVLNVDDALRIAEAAVKAGVDWLEAGTPLITFEGVRAIGALAQAFPGVPVLADYKMMDGVRKYVVETANQGGRIATICAVASDASIREAVRAGQDSGVTLITDLYASPAVAGRAEQMAQMGVDSVYVHWGADQRREMPERDPLADLPAVVERVGLPVGVGTFSVEEGVRAFQLGASIAVIGVPLIQAENVEAALREYVERSKAAFHTQCWT